MEFKTKYNLGQSVWFVHNNIIRKKKIDCIKINAQDSGDKTLVNHIYTVDFDYKDSNNYSQRGKELDSNDMFESQQEIFEHLESTIDMADRE